MVTCYIALGSNLQDRVCNLEKAIESLKSNPCIEIEKSSSVIETEPQGGPPQEKFLNQVLKISTSLSPEGLLEVTQGIENKLGRSRLVKNGPRIIDLDILLYSDIRVNTEFLNIPHPRMFNRLFVLKPLLEIEPEIFDRLKVLRPHKQEAFRFLK